MAKAPADKSDWSPAKVDEQGRELIGDYPASGPARAIAIHKAGRKTDPDGVLTPEQIAAVNAGDAPVVEPAPAKPKIRAKAKQAKPAAKANTVPVVIARDQIVAEGGEG